jgi:hypothetical protein
LSSAAQTPQRIQLMLRMIAIAFQCDITRVATFQIENGGIDGRLFPFLSLHNPNSAHHSISHMTDANGRADQTTITQYEVGLYVYLLQQLKAANEGTGTMLDNSLVMFGNEMSDGAGHDYHNLPILLAGRAGGTVMPGRHLQFPSGSQVDNLYLTMLQKLGMSVSRFGANGTTPLAGV